MNHSNFTMTPNIAFDLLTNEYDLVAYQKLLRIVGMNNIWKGGNHALAARLNTSYGRIVKLKAALQKVGFIEIIPGDSAHGEADGWLILDVWERNNSATLSQDVQGLSPNVQGQDTLSPNEQGQNPVKHCVSPCHETNNPLSPNVQATLSPNEQHKEKISSLELDKSLEEKDISYEISKKRNFSSSEKAERLFKFWRKRMGSNRSVFTDKRRSKAVAVMKSVSYADCLRAVVGCTRSDWHMGRAPDNQTVFNEFERIFKDVEETEKFIKRYYKYLINRQLEASGNGTIQRSNGNGFETERQRRDREARKRIEFGEAADELLRREGII